MSSNHTTAEHYYLTTPIYYVNARPHLGHAYSTIVCDAIARQKRALGVETWFLTGTDEHGQKIERSAKLAGRTPAEFATLISAEFRGLWDKLGLTYDDYIRTTEPRHVRGVQKLFATLRDKGYTNFLTRTHAELDLTSQAEVEAFFESEKPDYVFLAAAKVGGIHANNTYPAEFIRDNLAIQTNVIHAAYKNNVKRLLFLGSSCIYPKLAPQPMKEEHLLTSELEPTNRPYALAKIAGDSGASRLAA